MTTDPRAALAQLVSALERHLEVCSTRRGEDDPNVVAAYDDVADAFEEYDSSLYEAFGEMTPLDIYGSDDDEGEDDEDGDDEDDDVDADRLDAHAGEDGDDSPYAGLDGEDVDFEDDED